MRSSQYVVDVGTVDNCLGLVVQPGRVDLIVWFVLAVQDTDHMLLEVLSRDSSSFLNVDRTFRVAGKNLEVAAVWVRAELGVSWG